MTLESTPSLPRHTPESQGVASSALLAFIEEARTQIHELHSFMLLRHGAVIAEGWWEPYGPEHPHVLFSLSKSFASTAAGLAAGEGLLALDATVLSFFRDEEPEEVSENLAAMRVWHLLSMSTGNAEDTTRYLSQDPDGNWARAFLARPVEHTPGTHFVYNSGATYMVSAIVQKVTGMTVLDYLQPRLFGPLGITGATWETCPRGINVGGWGLKLKTEDIARFGQLYLQDGIWKGERLLPEGWVEQASARQVPNGDNPESDWNQGYGYQFWRARHGAYRGDGAFGQYCVVMPEQDAVLAITAGLGNMQEPLNLVWKHLLPAFGPEALAEDATTQEQLKQQLASLKIRTPEGSVSSPLAAQVTGKTYRFASNEQKVEAVSFTFGSETDTLRIWDEHGEHTIPVGKNGAWMASLSNFNGYTSPRCASGAWTSEDTYVVKLAYYETPFCPTITAHFADNQLTYDFRMNVSFGPTERPQLVGQADEAV